MTAMRIIYSAGEREGAELQASRITQVLIQQRHSVKIAAYTPFNTSLKADWLLDKIRKKKNKTDYKQLLQEVEAFEPELIISDAEPTLSKIATELNIPFWLCSPFYLLDGIEWNRCDLKYLYTLNEIRNLTKLFRDQSEKILLYAPYGNVINPPTLREGYEWITPYHLKIEEVEKSEKFIGIIGTRERSKSLKLLLNLVCKDLDIYLSPAIKNKLYSISLKTSKYGITTGETSYLSDLIFCGKNIYISPTLKDYETTLNATTVNAIGIGYDLTQIELQETFAEGELRKILAKPIKEYFLESNERYLHELLSITQGTSP